MVRYCEKCGKIIGETSGIYCKSCEQKILQKEKEEREKKLKDADFFQKQRLSNK